MDKPTFGERAADTLASAVGSWKFVITQSCILVAWIFWNTYGPVAFRFDTAPFILLNLMLSFQAAYTGPIIMIAQNRQSDIDRTRGIADYEINKKSEIEIEDIQGHLHRVEESADLILLYIREKDPEWFNEMRNGK